MSLPRLMEHAAALEAIGDRYRTATPAAGVVASPVTFLGACIFAGAFGLGAKQAGGTMIGGIESSELPFGARTSQQGWPVLIEPQANWTNSSLASKLRSALGGLVPDVLIMNPPCSAYAKNGKRGGMADPVMCNLHACIELGFSLAPTVWAWELVPGIFEAQDGRAFLDGLAERAAGAGYRSYAFLTSSSIHGGYQNRKRFHFVASRVRIDFEGTLERQPPERRGWRPVSDAFGTLPSLNQRTITAGSLDAVLPHVPPGTYVNQVPDDVLARVYKPRGKQWDPSMGRPGVSRVRAMWDRPSATIVGGPSVVHPDEDRFLTVRENARLMGFPDTWEFPDGSVGYQEVGKGVTTHTARFLCEAIIAAVRSGTASEAVPVLDIVDFRPLTSCPGLTSDDSFKREWYKARHGAEWAGGSKPSGRPSGSGRRTVPSVRIATDNAEVVAACDGFGLAHVPLAMAVESDVAVVSTDAAGAILAAFSMGSCRAGRRVLCCPIDGLALPGIEVVGSVQGALDLVAAQAAPMLRAKLARLITELDDSLLVEALEALTSLTIEAPTEVDDNTDEEPDDAE